MPLPLYHLPRIVPYAPLSRPCLLTPSRHRPASWPILVRLVGRLAVTPPTRSPIPCNDENRAEADKLRKEVSKIQELMLAASAIDFFDEGQDDGDNHR